MARRATYLDELWNEGVPVLMVDAGDLFGRRQPDDKEQTRFLCEITSSFGYDAIGLGEADLNYGLDFLQEMIRAHRLPFTNANCYAQKTNELILPPYLIVERAGIKFGIISVLDPAQKIISMAAKEDSFRVEDPLTTLRALIPEVRKEAQTIVLLSHLADRNTEALLKEVQGIDVAVVGHTYSTIQSERVIGTTALLGAGHEGRFMGRANLAIDADGMVQSISVTMTGLDETVADDPVILEKVQQFKNHLDELRTAARGRHQQSKGSADEQFLGERSCRKCHADVWNALQGSAHQSAFASLAKKGQQYTPECLVCHVVGYEHIGGYDDKPPFNGLVNVQCEACHGYGTEHRRDGKWKREATESCAVCHDKENSPEFDFATYWEKIKH